jgi:uncharacterized membrane protein YeaQ/YmgE (transglycosylase-associated protein family)
MLLPIVLFLVIGAIAGWLAGEMMTGTGYGLLSNMVLGVIGAIVGGLLFSMLGIAFAGLLGQLIVATIGAMVVIFLVYLVFPVAEPV